MVEKAEEKERRERDGLPPLPDTEKEEAKERLMKAFF